MVNNGCVEPAETAPQADAPAQPITAAPDQPVTDASGRPSVGSPGRPVTEASGRPSAGSPGRPVVLGRREGRSPRDMILSLTVLLVPIALLLIFYRVVLSGDAPVTVDPSSAIQEARSSRAFPVVVPNDLGDDWHVSTATFRRATEGATLRIGYVAPDDDSALLVQSSIPPDMLLPTELGQNAKPIASFRAANGAWRRYETRRGESALVLAEPGRTVVVVGNTDEEHLETLASSLS